MAPSCFRLEATRGPHTGSIHHYCSLDQYSFVSPSTGVHDLSIGRKKRCWLRLPQDLEVSSVHAEFRFIEDGNNGAKVAIRDVKSTNGTKLNGKPLKPRQDYPLSDKDLVAVGRTSLRFVQVVHGQPCGDEGDDDTAPSSANANAILTTNTLSSGVRPAPAPVVIVLDEDSAESAEEKELHSSAAVAPVSAPASARVSEVSFSAEKAGDTPADQPDIEPALDEEVVRAVKNVVVVSADKENGNDVDLMQKPEKAKVAKRNTGCVNEYTPEDSTSAVCSAVIGQLDLLEQQAHLNECLGGRVAANTAEVAALAIPLAQIAAKANKPKVRKRGNTEGGTTRAKKPRKPKAGADNDGSAVAASKAKKPRKQKRAGGAENIELAMALAGGSKMNKEQQTDIQLATTKKKLEQLDEQIAKLAKRRTNLVKKLDRLERTKQKLRKSQVLPPAKVLQFLDLKAALDIIFPSSRLAQPTDRHADKELSVNGSVVAKRYAPSRWSESEIALHCDEEKPAELVAVAAISMWACASQQLSGLARDTLLYRNSILRAFLGDDEVADSSMDLDDLGGFDNEDGDADFERGDADFERGDDSEKSAELKPLPTDQTAEVPDVVKRVFPNWQRDIAFIHDQTAEELEMALEAMNAAQAQASGAVEEASEPNQKEVCRTEVSEEQSAEGSESEASMNLPTPLAEQRLACEYMAQVMRRLIAEKRQQRGSIAESDGGCQQQRVIDLASSNGEEIEQRAQHSGFGTARTNGAEEEPYS